MEDIKKTVGDFHLFLQNFVKPSKESNFKKKL